MTKDAQALKAIGNAMLTQDNRCTAYPIFLVQQGWREYGYDPEYATPTVWIDTCNNREEANKEEAKKLCDMVENGENIDGWVLTGYVDRWEFVTACFTEKGAQDFIKINGHNLGESRIYVDSLWRNEEMKLIRRHLISAAKEETTNETN